ncbi:MAG: penicillin-binding protein activator [Gammaproteobacteria bacterium]
MPKMISFILSLLLLTSCAGVASFQTSQSSPPKTLQSNPKHIALMVPLSGPYASAGKAVRDGFLSAYYSVKPTTDSPTIVRVYDTGSGRSIRDLYQNAMAENADIIVGPLQKDEVNQLAKLAPQVPVIALNYPKEARQLPQGFYEFGLSPINEAMQTADRVLRDGHHQAILIYPKNTWGTTIANAYVKTFQQQGGKVVGNIAYSDNENFDATIRDYFQVVPCPRNKHNCQAQRRQDFDAIFVVATPQKAQQIIPMLHFYYLGDIPTYSIASIYQGTPDQATYRDMDGVQFGDFPWIINNNPQLQTASQQLNRSTPDPFVNPIRLYALGIDAYALVNQLSQLATTPGANYNGATGTLYVNNQQVLRQLSWAKFRDGLVTGI